MANSRHQKEAGQRCGRLGAGSSCKGMIRMMIRWGIWDPARSCWLTRIERGVTVIARWMTEAEAKVEARRTSMLLRCPEIRRPATARPGGCSRDHHRLSGRRPAFSILECKGELSLHKAQEIVGGYVEMAYARSGVEQIILNEEGKIDCMKYNQLASYYLLT